MDPRSLWVGLSLISFQSATWCEVFHVALSIRLYKWTLLIYVCFLVENNRWRDRKVGYRDLWRAGNDEVRENQQFIEKVKQRV